MICLRRFPRRIYGLVLLVLGSVAAVKASLLRCGLVGCGSGYLRIATVCVKVLRNFLAMSSLYNESSSTYTLASFVDTSLIMTTRTLLERSCFAVREEKRSSAIPLVPEPIVASLFIGRARRSHGAS